jgi:DinB superfamily
VIGKPDASEFNPFYTSYVGRVPEDDILAVLAAQPGEIEAIARGVAAERETFRYEPRKWSVRQLLGHVCDAERVFGYRAFCIGRGESAALPGFDENAYVETSGSDAVALATLAEEFGAVRRANLLALQRIGEAAWRNVGSANGSPISVRGLAYIMAGHVRHHVAMLQERYGVV